MRSEVGYSEAGSRRASTKSQGEDVRRLLISSAKKAFSEFGYEGTSIRLLAKVSGVNLGAISYYFGGKEGLYRACLEPFAEEGLKFVLATLKTPSSGADFRTRLRIFVDHFIDMQINQAEVCQILEREFPSPNPITVSVIKRSFEPLFNELLGFFSSAMEAGIVAKRVDPEVASAMLIGTLSKIVKMEKMRKHVNTKHMLATQQKDTTLSQVINIFCDGILA